MSSVFEKQVIKLVAVTQEELLKKEREAKALKTGWSWMQTNEKRHKKAGGEPEALANCVTTNSSAMKVAGQREKCLSNLHYYRAWNRKARVIMFVKCPNKTTWYWTSLSLITVLECTAHPCKGLKTFQFQYCQATNCSTEQKSFLHVILVDELQIPHNSGHVTTPLKQNGLNVSCKVMESGDFCLKQLRKLGLSIHKIQVIFFTIFLEQKSLIHFCMGQTPSSWFK